MGKIKILAIFIALVVALQAQTLRLSYLIQHEIEESEDYLVTIIVANSESQSLADAIQESDKTANQIKEIGLKHCKLSESSKIRSACKSSVEVSNVQIQPKYMESGRSIIYQSMKVHYEVRIRQDDAHDRLGGLIDEILLKKGLVIKGFEWKPKSDANHAAEAVKEGVQKGELLCEELGMSLKTIIHAEELREVPEKPEEQPEPEGEEEEEEQEAPEQEEEEQEQQKDILKFRFDVECEGDGMKKVIAKRKKREDESAQKKKQGKKAKEEKKSKDPKTKKQSKISQEL